MPLELFFDLVFVLALTQCTALMAAEPTWEGLAKGVLVLGVLWWAWVGYAWLTSVVDPEEWLVRSTMFAAMGALLIVALAVPEAFGDLALLFACAYAFVRIAHIALFVIIGRDDPAFLRSTTGLAIGTAIGFSPAGRRVVRRRAHAGRCCGPSRWPSTSASRSCSAARAGASSPATSPSGTGCS